MDEVFPMIVEKKFKALGTEISLQFVAISADDLVQAKKEILDIIALYEKYTKMFSRFDAQSELSHLNENIGKF